MPLYEYEPDDHDCLICEGRFGVLQGIEEPPCPFCPTCGLPCHRVISRATFKVGVNISSDRTADKGFTKWKKSGKGVWEKISGPGEDYLVGSDEDMKAIEEEKRPKKVLDLDEEK